MLRIPRELKAFDGLGWGKKASTRLAGGPMYHEFIFRTNARPQDILSIALVDNGDRRVECDGATLKFLERYKKQFEQDGYYVLALSDISNFGFAAQVFSGLNTMPSDNLTLEVKFAADPGGLGDLYFYATAWVSSAAPDAPVADFEPRLKLVNFKGGPANKDLVLDNLHTVADGSERIQRVHFYGGASDYIDRLEIRRDGNVVYEETVAEMRFNQKRKGRAPQDLWVTFDPIASGFALDENFSTAFARELQFRLRLTGALTDVPAIIETVELQK